jgi:hypothetical protein
MEETSRLATDIRLSPKIYWFQFPFQPIEKSELRKLHSADLDRFDVLDQASGMLLKPAHVFKEAADGTIGEILCVIFPAFVRKTKENRPDIVLVKATILAGLHAPVQRAGRRKDRSTADERGRNSEGPEHWSKRVS